MKSHINRTIANRLKMAKVGLSNATKDAEVQAALSLYKYDAPRIAQGLVKHAAAENAVSNSVDKRGALRAGVAHAVKSRKAVQVAFQRMAKVSRAAFAEEPATLARLGLDRRMPAREADFVQAARTLFNTTAYTAAMRAALADNGYDDAKLSGERSKIAELEFAIQNRENCRGGAQQAVADQRTALKDMDRWMSSFAKVARVALADRAQLVEKLGLFTRNSRTPAQRGAAAKAAATRKQKLLDIAA
jgi:hypothetical protein